MEVVDRRGHASQAAPKVSQEQLLAVQEQAKMREIPVICPVCKEDVRFGDNKLATVLAKETPVCLSCGVIFVHPSVLAGLRRAAAQEVK